jgi:hypothetical protein
VDKILIIGIAKKMEYWNNEILKKWNNEKMP